MDTFFQTGAANGALTIAGRIESEMRTALSFSYHDSENGNRLASGKLNRLTVRYNAQRDSLFSAYRFHMYCYVRKNLTREYQEDINKLFPSL